MRFLRWAVVGALGGAAVLATAIYVLQYRGRLGPRQTERLLRAGTQTRSVRCVRGWRVGLFSDWSYVGHWTYQCTFVWKRGLGPPERLGVRVDSHNVIDSEIG
jgi:predicted membrane-bound mannosyltransferase